MSSFIGNLLKQTFCLAKLLCMFLNLIWTCMQAMCCHVLLYWYCSIIINCSIGKSQEHDVWNQGASYSSTIACTDQQSHFMVELRDRRQYHPRLCTQAQQVTVLRMPLDQISCESSYHLDHKGLGWFSRTQPPWLASVFCIFRAWAKDQHRAWFQIGRTRTISKDRTYCADKMSRSISYKRLCRAVE